MTPGSDTPPHDTQTPGAPVAEAWHEPAGEDEAAFARGMAHDLRAPLRGIDSFSLLLEERAGATLDADARAHLQRIRAAATRMRALVEGVHEYAQARYAALRPASVDLSLLADWIGAELQDLAPGRAASITVAPGLEAFGDEHWLRAALQAVMRNAWQFSAQRERIEIAVEGEAVGDRVRVRVRDAGIGFDPAYADKLFVPFQRLHTPEQGAGAGLGLALAWRIVQRHGGRMRARGAPAAGCTIEIELPRTGAAPADRQQAGAWHG